MPLYYIRIRGVWRLLESGLFISIKDSISAFRSRSSIVDNHNDYGVASEKGTTLKEQCGSVFVTTNLMTGTRKIVQVFTSTRPRSRTAVVTLSSPSDPHPIRAQLSLPSTKSTSLLTLSQLPSLSKLSTRLVRPRMKNIVSLDKGLPSS